MGRREGLLMGLFNSLRVLVSCPSCSARAVREVQFRFGHVWQHDYVIGSRLEWKPTGSAGDPNLKRAVVDAWLDAGPTCSDERGCVVLVHDGVLVGVDFQTGAVPPVEGMSEQ